jgi:hypothetical protein
MSDTTDDLEGTQERPPYYFSAIAQGATGADLRLPDPEPTDGPLSSLTDEQRARVGALHLVRGLLVAQGALGAKTAPDVFDLMRLAEWVLTGVDLVDLMKPTDEGVGSVG